MNHPFELTMTVKVTLQIKDSVTREDLQKIAVLLSGINENGVGYAVMKGAGEELAKQLERRSEVKFRVIPEDPAEAAVDLKKLPEDSNDPGNGVGVVNPPKSLVVDRRPKTAR